MTYQPDIDRYCDGVLSGEIVAGKLVRYAVERYLRDVEMGHERGLWFDDDAATRNVNFFHRVISHTKGEYAGQPFELREFQKFIQWNLFGWKRESADGNERRRFRKAFLSFARGNGKSPLAAGNINYLAWADEPVVPRAECYCVATKEAQAKIGWTEAKCQIEACRSPKLRKAVRRMTRNMHSLSTWAKLEPLGSDSDGSDGLIVHGLMLDELHAWREHHRGLKEKLETSMKGEQPMCIIVTTAGDERSQLWIEEYEWAVNILTPNTGVDDDDLFAFIAEVDADAPCGECDGSGCEACKESGRMAVDPLDERYWPMANPMLNEARSPIKLDQLRSMAKKARTRPEVLNAFRRYHANQRVTSISKFLTLEQWAKGNRSLPEFSSRECCLGMDWGWKDDLASLAAVFQVGEEYAIKVWSWIPRDGPRDLSAEPWRAWVETGVVRVTDGDMTDPEAMYRVVEDEILPECSVVSAAFDQHAAMEFGIKCQGWGIKEYAFTQSQKKYNEPMREFSRLLSEGRIIHGGNPLLAWCVGHLTTKSDAWGYIMPNKDARKEKIDPLCAMFMAFSECKYAAREEEFVDCTIMEF